MWKEEDWHFRGVFSRETFGYVIVLAQFGLVSVPLSPPLSSPSFLFVLLLPSVVLKTIQKQPEAETLYCTAAIYSILSLNHEIGLSLYVCVNNLYNPPPDCVETNLFFFVGLQKKRLFLFPHLLVSWLSVVKGGRRVGHKTQPILCDDKSGIPKHSLASLNIISL